ncbi:MAG: ABC transporter ATP-binding protein [Aestuariivirga sp.]|uniref:ABC transporter ATP-binding protein n=1 Tax=Aestuariivirga sp. TaxID=2650926 RepID=UPI0025C6784A|nr:ABC transporter ATP-binding protein [Aestuariivirga sp.]MCA3560767.1 ABC transporter ATP-binding protein [Aestuariivirga sp.]
MTDLVSIQHVSHSFGPTKVLDDVSLALEPNSYTVLLGPSGSGKTTLLSILGGFLAPEKGRVLIEGRDCTATAPAKRPTATVFQDYALFPHMTIGGNVGFGLRMKGVAKAERDAKARAMLDVVGLAAAFERKPHQLSGGQRQRVALARALIVEPAVLLLDEPLGALDLKLRRQMQDELKAIQKRVGTAFIHVTHDQEEAMALAGHLVVMNHGRIEDQGAPERVYAQPATRFTATFMGESTIVPGTVRDGVIDTALGRFPAAPDAREVAIRPEHVFIGGTLQGNVTDVVYQGSFKRVTARVNGVDLLARLPAGTKVTPGETVSLAIDPGHVIMLKD